MSTDLISKCRTCLSESNSYYQLIDYVDENYKILEMLDSCVPHIDVKNSLQFSNLMCPTCVDKLLNAYKFQEMCIKSNEHLSTLLIKTEPEKILVQMTDEPSIQIKNEVEQPDELQQELEPVNDGNAENGTHSIQFDLNNPQKEVSGTVCSICGKKFRRNAWLQLHMVTHSNERPFLCPHCDKSFPSERHLKYHLHVHNKKCSEDSLLKEIRTKTAKIEKKSDQNNQQKPTANTVCTICGICFRYNSKLKEHMVTHSDERPFQCTHCNKSFPSERYLKYHLHSHTQVYPFKCTQCGKSFRRPYALRNHLRVHSDETPFKCPQCGRPYKFLYNLNRHMQTHADAKKYECKFCARHFYIKSIWEKHARSHSDRHNLIKKNLQHNEHSEESSSNESQGFSDNELDEEEHKEQIKVPLITAKEELEYIQQIFEITMPDLD